MLKLTVAFASLLALLIPLTAVVNVARGEEGIVLREVAGEIEGYCHTKYMAFKVETLGWPQPEFNPDDLVDFYGPCSFDPLSQEEIQNQRAQASRSLLSDGGADSATD